MSCATIAPLVLYIVIFSFCAGLRTVIVPLDKEKVVWLTFAVVASDVELTSTVISFDSSLVYMLFVAWIV